MTPATDLRLARRPRRLRASATLREIVRETTLRAADLILPLFVSAKISSRQPVASMPGVFQLTVAEAATEARLARDAGVRAVLLFGIPAHKDELGSGAYDDDGVVQQAARALKAADPDLVIIADVCLCEYTSHGHCGVTEHGENGHFHVHNDASVALLARTAVSLAAAGCGHRGPQRHDGRPRRRDPRGARRTRLPGHADHELRVEVRQRVLRAVPRRGGRRTAVRRPAHLPDGPGQRARSSPRGPRSTWRNPPTCSSSNRGCRT